VSGASDVNGDGLSDVIVGVPAAEPNGLNAAGRTYVVFGKVDTDKVSLADVTLGIGGFAVDGEAANDLSGGSVRAVGDMNGDGLDELVLSAPSADPNGLDRSGRAYVVFGKSDTERVSLAEVALGAGGFALDGEAWMWAYYGLLVGSTEDINGDGIPDILVGAPYADPNDVEQSGRTYVVFGGDFSCEGG
jgi:hypothetical protein